MIYCPICNYNQTEIIELTTFPLSEKRISGTRRCLKCREENSYEIIFSDNYLKFGKLNNNLKVVIDKSILYIKDYECFAKKRITKSRFKELLDDKSKLLKFLQNHLKKLEEIVLFT